MAKETKILDRLPSETLGLAGEYAVASELARRGIYSQLTLGNRNRTDLLVDVEDGKMLRVQVKAKQGREWPGCKGVCGNANVLVFVDYQSKKLEDPPDFFILLEMDWRQYLKANITDTGMNKKWGTTWGDDLIPRSRLSTSKSTYVGTSVFPKQIAAHQNRWDKIHRLIDPAWNDQVLADGDQ